MDYTGHCLLNFLVIEIKLMAVKMSFRGPGSSVGIVTGYGLDGPLIESRPGEIFRPCGSPSLPYNEYRVFPGGKGSRGVGLTPHPHLRPRS